jgi:cytidine deaminase
MMTRLQKKATQSKCRYRVSAMALNKKGELIAFATNKPRFSKYHGSIHAEMALMARYGTEIHTIIITRVGRSGKVQPIHPCDKCSEVAKSLGIKIRTVEADK